MSEVGHERRFRDVCRTSALPPILTVTADILNRLPISNIGPNTRPLGCARDFAERKIMEYRAAEVEITPA
jgi:hypothetical protein